MDGGTIVAESDEIVLYRKLWTLCIDRRRTDKVNCEKVVLDDRLMAELGWTFERLLNAARDNVIAGRIRSKGQGWKVCDNDIQALKYLRIRNIMNGVRFTTAAQYSQALGWTEQRFRVCRRYQLRSR